ncbi:hypothetical protein B4V02_07725 [Paenibacillus kribbensis]|uniref:DUF4145 domain-containing protein n=1 Tax=Paenibacillus kribbensis TaxID=172713 RepID=A0A222WLB5_9BACL|nr:hypothetical protein [Paenibacillus kribbensis]ASR46571.1 hypothetical protein B4V02_07725 [Paenibacillus kribbensis]
MSNIIFISKSIFDWDYYSDGGKVLSSDAWTRSYKIWEHSKTLIDKAITEFELADGIANLKRALNHRLKLIESYYNFRNMDASWKNKGYLEILESFELVRPYLMKNLLSIRNDIEHNDAKPPGKERCNEFIDIVWYFLKSTDPIVQILKYSNAHTLYDEDGYETQYGFSYRVDFSDLSSINFTGWFYNEIISNEPREGLLTIEFSDIHNKKKWKENNFHNDKLESDKWIHGEIVDLDIQTKKMIVSKVLSAI